MQVQEAMQRIAIMVALCATVQGFNMPMPMRSVVPLGTAGRGALTMRQIRAAPRSALVASAAGEETTTAAQVAEPKYRIPKNEVEMIQDCAEAVGRAQAAGVSRHKVRLMLPGGEVSAWGTLCPTDESWEGGIMQLYGACSPLVRSLLRKCSKNDLAPTLSEQRLDESGVDGISLWTAQCQKARDDIYAFCQPSTETIEVVKDVCKNAGPRSVLMVNPQWRETKDGYDLAGEKPGLFGQIGNFLGGTAGARKEVAALGFEDVYLLQEYTVNGDACRILKSYPNPNWQTYIIMDNSEPTLLGEQPGRPTYQDIAALLESKGIPAKWARDMGMGVKDSP